MNYDIAKRIIINAVESTKIRWKEYEETWDNIEEIFLSRAFEQGGFQAYIFADLLKEENIFSIDKLGTILNNKNTKYDREYAGSINKPFYKELSSGLFGEIGKKFFKCVKDFNGNRGGWYWRELWQMLVCINHLKVYYNSSFSYFIRKKYGEFLNKNFAVSDMDFLSIDEVQWEIFKQEKKPWKELYGIGENVFDFIFGDVIEAKFVTNSYKLDSSNQYFFKVTGINKLFNKAENNRKTVMQFLKQLELPYTLREINKGIYTYCSETESKQFGFCRNIRKCETCKVKNICEKKINVA